MEKNSFPSFSITPLAECRMPLQSRWSVQPKNGFIQPSGIDAAIIAGDTFTSAMVPIVSAVSVKMANWVTSVITTLIIPPLIAYSDVSPSRIIA